MTTSQTEIHLADYPDYARDWDTSESCFSLSSPGAAAATQTTGWLVLGLASLVIGGLFTILIVLSRTPYFQEIIPWTNFFHTALVVHVDLTVLVWFLSFSGVFWSYSCPDRLVSVGWAALFLCAFGTLLIAISPFTGNSPALMSNYVPVLENQLFFIGLGVFGLGYGLLVLRILCTSWVNLKFTSGEIALRFGLFVAAVAAALALASLLFSYLGIDEGFTGQAYYDRLFWGSGHVIQFTHTQLLLVAWLLLATVSGATLRVSPRVVLVLFVMGLSPLLMVPVIYMQFDVSSGNHVFWFTQLMKYGGALGALPIGMAVAWALFDRWHPVQDRRAERSALMCSVALFGIGGVIGFMIHTSNVTVPAHYHGSIVGITIAYMGVTYYLLPKIGFRPVSGLLARWQPVIYGVGQMLHIIGLAWSGGYGVQRKTVGTGLEVDQIEHIASMALMGLGGLISIIGGLLFLVVVFAAIKPAVKQKNKLAR